MKINFNAEYEPGDVVYLITDPDDFKRVVIGYSFYNGCVLYILKCCDEVTEHEVFEFCSLNSNLRGKEA
jgi:hypothetical protein